MKPPRRYLCPPCPHQSSTVLVLALVEAVAILILAGYLVWTLA